MKKCLIIVCMCAVALLVGCTNEEAALPDITSAAEALQAASVEPVPSAAVEDAVESIDSDGDKAAAPARNSAVPVATEKPISSVTPGTTGQASSSDNASVNQSAGSNAGNGSTAVTTAPATETPNTATPAPVEVAPAPEFTPQPTPEPTPTPAPTPPPVPEPPKQGGYAYCSCGAALSESDYVAHMKEHALNGEDHYYDTY